jgi:hypothetical protein
MKLNKINIKQVGMIRTLATRKSDKIPFPPSNSLPKAAVSLALKVIHDCKNIDNLLSVTYHNK